MRLSGVKFNDKPLEAKVSKGFFMPLFGGGGSCVFLFLSPCF